MKMKIVNTSNNPNPEYKTEEAAGMDLTAYLDETVELKPMERKLIPTGLFIELEKGYEAQVRPRSGLAGKEGLTVLNTPGTIDSDYRGEIKVILINLSNETREINNGERIAQMVISPYEKAEIINVESLSETVRGEDGFGSSGKK